MFENYVGSKTQKRRKWVSVLITTSAVVHAILVVVLIVRSFWVIEKLALPKGIVSQAVVAALPPPPPPPPASKKVTPKTDVVKKVVPKDLTQPVAKKEEEPVEIVAVDEGVEGGVEGGVPGGVPLGMVGGSLEGLPGGALPPPPPPPPAPPKIVPPDAVKAQRLSGETQISPDDATKLQIQRDGQSRVTAVVKMCLSADGNVSSLSMLKSSGYPDYDRKIQSKMRQWRHRPFLINGQASAICTSITFDYRQSQ